MSLNSTWKNLFFQHRPIAQNSYLEIAFLVITYWCSYHTPNYINIFWGNCFRNVFAGVCSGPLSWNLRSNLVQYLRYFLRKQQPPWSDVESHAHEAAIVELSLHGRCMSRSQQDSAKVIISRLLARNCCSLAVIVGASQWWPSREVVFSGSLPLWDLGMLNPVKMQIVLESSCSSQGNLWGSEMPLNKVFWRPQTRSRLKPYY